MEGLYTQLVDGTDRFPINNDRIHASYEMGHCVVSALKRNNESIHASYEETQTRSQAKTAEEPETIRVYPLAVLMRGRAPRAVGIQSSYGRDRASLADGCN